MRTAMTPELSVEDVELILGYKRYIKCPPCLRRIQEDRRILNASCRLCKAWGIIPNPRYVELAQQLSLPIPFTMEEIKIRELEGMRMNGVKIDQAFYDDLLKDV